MMKFRNIKKIFFAAAAVGMLLTGCEASNQGTSGSAQDASAQSTTEKNENSDIITLRFGYVANNSNVVGNVNGIALQQGYFDEELSKVGARIEFIPFVKAGPAINAALASNELDASTLGDVPAIVAKSQGTDTTLIDVNTFDYSTLVLVRKGLDAKDIPDLKGKKIALQTSSYMYRIFNQIIDKYGLKPDDFEIINMSEAEAGTAIAAGSVDATICTEMKGVKLIQDKSAKVIFDTEKEKNMQVASAYVFRTEFAKSHPDIVEAYLRALIRSQDYAKDHPEDLRQLYIDSGIEEAVVDGTYPSLSDYHANIGTTDDEKEIMQTVIDFLKSSGSITNDVDLNTWFDGSYYEKAKASLEK